MDHLDAAGGGTGTGSDKADHIEEHLDRLGPLFIISGAKTGGGEQGHDLKCPVPEGIDNIGVGPFLPENQSGCPTEKNEKTNVPAEFSIDFQKLSLSPQYLVDENKAQAPQKHEEDDNPVKIGAVVVADTRIFRWIAGGWHGTESGAEGIEDVHPAKGKKDSLDNIESDVNPPQPDHGVPVAGFEFFFGNDLAWAWFRPKEA